MSNSTESAASPTIEKAEKRVSSVILHHVPPERVDEFLEWERGVTQAAEAFPGYQTTDIYPPDDPSKREWVVVVHFNELADLKRWNDSAERREWVGKLDSVIGDFQAKVLSNGFASWFAGMVTGGPAPWQMALTVVFALYPTVMILNILLGRFLSPLGMAASMLVGNIMSVSILQWALMPLIERALSPWLHAEGRDRNTRLIVGAALMAIALVGMVFAFRLVTG